VPTAPDPIQEITDLPLSTDPTNFDTRADQSWTELKQAIEDMNVETVRVYDNALEVADNAATIALLATAGVAATDHVAVSTSILTVDAGSKLIHLDGVDPLNPPGFAVDDLVVAIYRPDPTVRLFASVTATDGVDDITASVSVGGVINPNALAGPLGNWIIMSAAFFAASATAAEVRAGDSEYAPVTAKALTDAAAFQTLTYGATINTNVALGWNSKVTLAGNPTFAAPTNLKDGVTYCWAINQGTGGHTATWNAIFDWGPLGAPTLSTAASKVDFAFGIYSSATGKLHMTFRHAA
jgi:hypothetical protein